MNYTKAAATVAVALAGGVLLAPQLARADGVTAILQFDTYIGGGVNHGPEPALTIDASRSALVRFQLDTLPRTTTAADIELAQLVLFPNSVTAGGGLIVRAVRGRSCVRSRVG